MGKLDTAKALVEAAAVSGADAVKFQLFHAEDILREFPRSYRRWELKPDWVVALAKQASDYGIDFLCTPFAPWACDVLRPYVKVWKIGSFEALDPALWEATADKPRIVSLGQVADEDLDGLLARDPKAHWLHCVSEYPTELCHASLARLALLKTRTDRVGFSDHTTSSVAAAAAIALGARVIEHHLKLKDQQGGPDTAEHAFEPRAFEDYVADLSEIYNAIDPILGAFHHSPCPETRRLHGN